MPFSKKPIRLNNKAYNIFKDNLTEIYMSDKCEHCEQQKKDLLEMDRRFIHLIKYDNYTPSLDAEDSISMYPTIVIKNKSNNKNIMLPGYKNKEYILKLATILDKHNN